ncbi:MAG: DUF87 domain-containing protein [Eubacterium sp.]|jgi:hypothetical protein|nr:DUF87 domain-containing protein [Eubacterium sp.]
MAVTPVQMLDLIKSDVDKASFFINKSHLIDLEKYDPYTLTDILGKDFLEIKYEKSAEMLFLKLNKLVFDKTENLNDKLTSVYAALYNFMSSIILIVDGKPSGIDYYIGISHKETNVAYNILEKGLFGNFPGINKHHNEANINSALDAFEMADLLDKIIPADNYEGKAVSSVFIVPGSRDEDKDKFVQGIEKFIDTMAAMEGETYTAVFISTPLPKAVIEDHKLGLEALYSEMSKVAKPTISYAENTGETVTEGTNQGISDTISEGISKSNTSGSSFSFMGFGTNSGTAIAEIYNEAHAVTKGVSNSISNTAGTTSGIQITYEDKTIINLMEKIDEQLVRIKNCESYGMWESACYFISDSNETAMVAANAYKALVAGEETSVENSFVNLWRKEQKYSNKTVPILQFLRCGMHPLFIFELALRDYVTGDVYNKQREIFSSAAMVSGKELPLLMGLPQSSVSGFVVVEQAPFGRDVFTRESSIKLDDNQKRAIDLGCVYHMDKSYYGNRILLDVNSLTSHCFVTGSTGSGKSNTVYKMLQEIIADKNRIGNDSVKFLVIEPAKGEYKLAFGNLPGINIFTTNPNYNNMLSINPFEFNNEIHVLEHLDRLIEIFSACWPLYAAMPALLKASYEKSYIIHGWDLKHSVWIDRGNGKYPTFNDVLVALPQILNEKQFSADTKGDYIGALVTRVESLTNGLTGQIFTSNAIDEDVLFNENTIIDLSRVGSSETQALIMGLLVLKLSEFRQSEHKGLNLPLKHVTVLEEAHNLLKRTSTEQGMESANVQGKSVEMISRSIAEMRTYGEGFIIVDQSPSSVDISAIKNTNTKIVMNLPLSTDCETVGRAIGLHEEQILELSRLIQGVAVVYQNRWLESVLVHIDKAENNYEILAPAKNNRDNEKRLLGGLLTELFTQREVTGYSLNRLHAVIDNFSENKSLKNRLTSIINEFHNCYISHDSKSTKNKAFLKMVDKIIDAKGLFDIFKDKLPPVINSKSEITQDYLVKCKAFMNSVSSYLDVYITVEDEKLKRSVFEQLLKLQALESRDRDRYSLLWNIEAGII